VNWETARKNALERDNGFCRRCPARATDVHHRKAKGMGGTRNEETGFGLANLVSLCRKCHHHVHTHPRESYEFGWMVHSWSDPADIPAGEQGNLSIGGLTGHPGACGSIF
jgi:5-methylcytosine-specific restriction endonuclease McrA